MKTLFQNKFFLIIVIFACFIGILLFLYINASREASEDNYLDKDIHFVFLADVSHSMKDAYENNNLKGKSSKIYELFEDITKDLSLKNNKNLQVSGILFGTKKEGQIADLLSLTHLANKVFNFEEFRNSKEKLIKLLEKFGAKYIRNYMNKESSPNEKECNFFYNILKDDEDFCRKIVDSLPIQCKTGKYADTEYDTNSWLSSILGSIKNKFVTVTDPFVSVYGKYSGKEDKIIINEINQEMKKCVLHKINEPLNTFEWNKKYYETKPAKEVLDSIKLLKGQLPLRGSDIIFDTFSDYIYGTTPLKKAIQKTIEIIKQDYKNTIKIIVILSNGKSSDGNPNDLKYLITQKNTYIVTLYFSSNKVKNPKQLYYSKPKWDKGLEQLYNLASEINPYSPIFDMLEKRGWKIDFTKKSKLFIQANSVDLFKEFLEIVNSFVHGQNILGNMISKIKFDDYITSYNMGHRITENQNKLPICWSHSLAKVIEYASHRIYRGKYKNKYPYPTFDKLRDYLVKEFLPEGKSNEEMMKILDKILPKYYLSYTYYNRNQEEKVKLALMRGRPLVLTFEITGKQQVNFANFFFKENKTGILTKEILNRDIPYNLYKNINDGGHAVVLIEYNEDGFVLLNSWGKEFGDNGVFRIKNINVFNNPFIIDIDLDKSKLPDDLRREWNEYSQKNERKFKDKYFYNENIDL